MKFLGKKRSFIIAAAWLVAVAGLLYVLFVALPKRMVGSAPTNTQARVEEVSKKVEFTTRCVNGKQALIVKAEHDLFFHHKHVADTYMMWDIDMSGRPMQCAEPAEVGMK